MENAKRSGENYVGRELIFIRTRRMNFLVATDFKNFERKDIFYFVITFNVWRCAVPFASFAK